MTHGKGQRGAVNLIVVVLMLLVVGAGIALAASMVSTSVGDAVLEDDSTAALYLAESGLEAAVGNLNASSTCTGVGVGAGGAIAFGRGTYTIQGATVVGTFCQIVVVGAIGNVTRTIQADVEYGGGVITFDAHQQGTATGSGTFTGTVAHTAAATASAMIVAIAVRSSAATSPVQSVTYGGVNLTLREAAVHSSGAAALRSELWANTVAPATGANDVVVSFDSTASIRAVIHTLSLTGTARPDPIDTTGASGACISTLSSGTAGVFLTTSRPNSLIVDALAVLPDSSATPSLAGQIGFEIRTGGGASGGHIRGGTSRRPIAAAGLTALGWTISPSAPWVDCGFTVLPGGATRIVNWTEL